MEKNELPTFDDNIIDLDKYKDEILVKKILEDVNNIILIIEKSQQALSYFKQYKVSQELVSIMETNKILLQLSKKKYESKKQST